MYYEVSLGLTLTQAEYLRAVVDSEMDSVAADLGALPLDADHSELNETLEVAELIENKLSKAIENAIRERVQNPSPDWLTEGGE